MTLELWIGLPPQNKLVKNHITGRKNARRIRSADMAVETGELNARKTKVLYTLVRNISRELSRANSRTRELSSP